MRKSPLLRNREVKIVPRRMAANDPDERDGSSAPRENKKAAPGEDLPYTVELWNEAKTAVELLLAVTASGSIGHAAFYAAAREWPDRYITLRHKQAVLNRWNAPSN